MRLESGRATERTRRSSGTARRRRISCRSSDGRSSSGPRAVAAELAGEGWCSPARG